LKNIKKTISLVVSNIKSGSNEKIEENLKAIRLLLAGIITSLNNSKLPTDTSTQDLRVVQAEIEHLFDLIKYTNPAPYKPSGNTNSDLNAFEHTAFVAEIGVVMLIGILTIMIALLTLFSYFARKWVYEEISDRISSNILTDIRRNQVVSYYKHGLIHFYRFDKARKKKGFDIDLFYNEELDLAIELGRLSIDEQKLLEKESKDKGIDKYNYSYQDKSIVLCNTAYYLIEETKYNRRLTSNEIEDKRAEALEYVLDSIPVLERCKKDKWKMWHQHKESQLYVLNELDKIEVDKLKESLKEVLNYKTARKNRKWCNNLKAKWKAVLADDEQI
jgi:hypothetical protein